MAERKIILKPTIQFLCKTLGCTLPIYIYTLNWFEKKTVYYVLNCNFVITKFKVDKLNLVLHNWLHRYTKCIDYACVENI